MAFKDWTRFFKRSDSSEHDSETEKTTASGDLRVGAAGERSGDDDQAASRQALVKELEQGFHHVGRVVEQLDHHLTSTNRLLESVANEQERLPSLMNELTAAASASRHAHESLAAHLSQRDDANKQLLAHLSTLSDSFELERDQHRSQLALVMRLQRGGRRLLVFLLLLAFLMMSLLLALVLVLALRPDLIGADHLPRVIPNESSSPSAPNGAAGDGASSSASPEDAAGHSAVEAEAKRPRTAATAATTTPDPRLLERVQQASASDDPLISHHAERLKRQWQAAAAAGSAPRSP